MKQSISVFMLVLLSLGSSTKGIAQDNPRSIVSGLFSIDTNQVRGLIAKSAKLKSHNVDSALFLLGQSLEMSRIYGYEQGIISSCLGIGICLIAKRDYLGSKQYLDSAYMYCFSGGPRSGKLMVLVYNALATYYTAVGDNNTAVKYYYGALHRVFKTGIRDSAIVCNIYANLGATFMQLNQNEKALHYLEIGRRMALRSNDSGRLADICRYLAITYENSGYYKRSEDFSKKAIEYYKAHHLIWGLQDAYYGLGRNYLLQEKNNEALNCFSLAMEIDPLAAANNSPLLQGLGGAYYRLGNYAKAEKYYKSALDICKRQGLSGDRLTIYNSLAKIYSATARYRQAYDYQVAYSDLFDSLNSEKLSSVTNQLEVKYRVAEKDKELSGKQLLLLQQQNRIKEKNVLLGGIGAGALLLVILLLSLYRNKRHKERLHNELVSNLNKEQEINALKAKLQGEEEERVRLARDLHDGVVIQFSAVKMNLSVLPEQHSSLAGSRAFDTIIQNLDRATRELRKTAHNLMPDALLANGLAEAVYYFCKDVQQSSNIIFDFQQYVELPRLHPEIELSLYRIIQELLQNIVKHAGASKVIVQLSHNDDLLHVTIEDNGKGFEHENLSYKNGIGLKNIHARMQSMKGNFEMETGTGSGTSVYLELDTSLYRAVPEA